MASPDQKATGADVVEMFSHTALPQRINPQRIKDIVEALRDLLRGSIHNAQVAEVQTLFERVLWTIAREMDHADAVLALASALDGLEGLVVRLAAAATSADPERFEKIERELAEAQTALTALRAERDAARTTAAEAGTTLAQERADRERERADLHRLTEEQRRRADDLAREIAAERSGREAQERARADEFRRALDALRREHTSATRALVQLTALAADSGAAHIAIQDILARAVAAAQPNGPADLAPRRATLTERLNELDAWVRQVDARQQDIAEELGAIIDEERQLQALFRTNATPETQKEIAALAARKRALEKHSRILVALKKPTETELGRIRELLRAIELVTRPPPNKAALPDIPEYPQLPDGDEAAGTPTTDATDAGAEPTAGEVPPSPLSIHLMVVLYELARQHFGAKPRVMLWIARCAEEVGVLARHALDHWAFTKLGVSATQRELVERFLTFHGRIGPAPSMNSFSRTDEPVPPEWESLVTNEERERFVAAFKRCITARAEAKARRTEAYTEKAEKAEKP